MGIKEGNLKMPTKHITDEAWDTVSKITLEATIRNKKLIRENQVIDYLILKATKNLTDKDLVAIASTLVYSKRKPAKTAKNE